MVKGWKSISLLCLLALCFSSCDRDIIGPQASNPSKISDSRRVLIINEGNFQRGNASIGYYNAQTKSYAGEHYQRKNASPMGDVLQSVYYENNKFFAVLNGSNRVLICDSSWNLESSFNALGAPRYMALTADKFYLSDLFNSEIGVYSASTLSLEKIINLNQAALAVKEWQGKVIVAAGKELEIYDPLLGDSLVYQLSLDVPIKSIMKNGRSQMILVDNQDQVFLWKQPLDSLVLLGTLNKAGDKFVLDYKEQELYSLAGSEVSVYSIGPDSLQQKRRFSHLADNVYGFSCDSLKGELYIMDPDAFVAPSAIYIYDRFGHLKDQFRAGFISNGALIRN